MFPKTGDVRRGFFVEVLMEDDMLINFGGEIKAERQGDGLHLGGYLVRFSTAQDPDLTGEYFTADTDFDLEDGQTKSTYFHHGYDAKVGKRKLGRATLRQDEIGVWAETILQERDEYEKFIAELALAGKLGWSSGSAGHLVEKASGHITRWPIVEASMTHTPAEPRNSVISIKTLVPGDNQPIAADAAAVPVQTETQTERNTAMDENLKTEVAELVKTAVSDALKAAPVNDGGIVTKAAPTVLKTGLGDTELKAYCHFLRTGRENSGMVKASNDTDMNIGTPADGGYTVPTGHYAGIIARRDEGMIANVLGVRRIPGMGTTVNVPIDDEADGEFISTGEVTEFDDDAPALNQKAFTLVKYTKTVSLSLELLRDEDAGLLAFLNDFVGRGMAKTHNSLLITEVAANGASLKTFASATTYAVGELETLSSGADLSAYLDDTSSVGWVTTRPNYAKIASLTGNPKQYDQNPTGNAGAKTLLGFPVSFSNKVATAAASAKSIYFGNWNFVGLREGNGFTMLRDPYSRAKYGQVLLHYYFDAVYGVLQSEAIGYGVHPTA